MDLETQNLRFATADDVVLLSRLVNSAYRGDSSREGWTTEADLVDGQRTDPEFLRELIATPGNTILLLWSATELIACVLLQNKGNHSYLGMLAVKPALQAKGVGQQLLAHAEEFVKTRWNLAIVEMTVLKQRLELIAWYERRGYRNTGRRESFPYGDARFGLPRVHDLEFIVLEKTLGGAQPHPKSQ